MYVLFTDTDCDVTPQMAEEMGYNLIYMPYYVVEKNSEKEYVPYQNGEKFDSHAFYEKLRKGMIVKTNALNPNFYTETFEPFFAKGQDILYIHFSAEMSGTFSAMNLALEELYEKYPERKLYQIDTRAITIGSLNPVIEVSQMYKEGKSVEEILKWAETEIDKFPVYFFAEDLNFFRRSGRVTGLAAFFGTLASIRPYMNMAADGKMHTCGKVRGRKAAIEKILSIVDELQENIKDHKVIVGHTDIPEVAADVVNKLKEKYGADLDVMVVDINPTIGSHCGPSALGVCFHAIHR